jgi:hypothetical protein
MTTFSQPGSLTRFWLWACIGVAALFGTFASAGAFVWPLAAAGIGLLAANAVSRRGALLACVAGLTGPLLTVAFGTPWVLVAALPVALALALVRTRREAVALTVALAAALVVLLALRIGAVELAIALAPALLVLAALAAGRPQREAAGAITGAGLALFAFGVPEAGIPLTLAGAVLMLALGMRRRRLALTRA